MDLTEQLLELGLIVEQEASHYAGLPPDAQPEALDRPPPDFLESYVILIATCSDVSPPKQVSAHAAGYTRDGCCILRGYISATDLATTK